jgi:transcription elongation factor Elf1
MNNIFELGSEQQKLVDEHPDWMKTMICPYCNKEAIEIRQMTEKPPLYAWECLECGETEWWLSLPVVFSDWEWSRSFPVSRNR